MGLWFSVIPTVETLVAQLVAAVLVIGSYFLARYTQVKRPHHSEETPAHHSEVPPVSLSEARI
jgi:high-affinity iron transporter